MIREAIAAFGATCILVAGTALLLNPGPARCQSGNCVSGLECFRDSDCGGFDCTCFGASLPFNRPGICGAPIEPPSGPIDPIEPPRPKPKRDPASPEPFPDAPNPDCSNPLPDDPRCRT